VRFFYSQTAPNKVLGAVLSDRMRIMFRKSRGFSLIELLVVIGIIGVLTTITVIAVQGNLKKSRDARRIADLQQVALALEVYKESSGAYPDCRAGFPLGVEADEGEIFDCTENIDIVLQNIITVPDDPRAGDADDYDYYYDSDVNCGSATIVLYAQTLEANTDEQNFSTLCTGSPSGFTDEPTSGYVIAID